MLVLQDVTMDNNIHVNFPNNIIKTTTCQKGCCSILTRDFNWIPDNIWDNIYSDHHKTQVKTGVFIVNVKSNKILLVQSCGYLWGPPKGCLNDNESLIDGAIREVYEETGLRLKSTDLKKIKKIKANTYYFYTEINDENDISIPYNIINDSSGITWININCLNSFIDDKGNCLLNGHCKALLLQYLKIKLPPVLQYSKPLFPFIQKLKKI